MSNKPVRFWYNFFKHLTIPLHDTFYSYFHSLVKTSSNRNKILERGKSIEKNYSNNLKKKNLKALWYRFKTIREIEEENLRWKIRDDYYSWKRERGGGLEIYGSSEEGVNLKALAVTPFLAEITVGPRVAFLRFVACLPIRSGDLVKQRGLNRPFMRTGGSWRGGTGISA